MMRWSCDRCRFAGSGHAVTQLLRQRAWARKRIDLNGAKPAGLFPLSTGGNRLHADRQCQGQAIVVSNNSANGVAPGLPSEGFSRTLLHRPADIAVDPNPDPVTGERGSVYVADGYATTAWWSSTGAQLPPPDGRRSTAPAVRAGGGGHSALRCDREQRSRVCLRSRQRSGQCLSEEWHVRQAIPVVPEGEPRDRHRRSAWDVDFSPDKEQTFMYESDGGNEIMWIFDHPRAAWTAERDPRWIRRPGTWQRVHLPAYDGHRFERQSVRRRNGGRRRVQKFINCGATRTMTERSSHGCRGDD